MIRTNSKKLSMLVGKALFKGNAEKRKEDERTTVGLFFDSSLQEAKRDRFLFSEVNYLLLKIDDNNNDTIMKTKAGGKSPDSYNANDGSATDPTKIHQADATSESMSTVTLVDYNNTDYIYVHDTGESSDFHTNDNQDCTRHRIGSNDSYLSNHSVSSRNSDGNLADDENILSDSVSLVDAKGRADISIRKQSHQEGDKAVCMISSRARHLQIDISDCTDDNHSQQQKLSEVVASIKECIHNIVVMCIQHQETSLWLSKLAMDKYKLYGRGCLLLVLPSLEIAKEFHVDDLKKLSYTPSYADKTTLLKSAGHVSKASILVSMCDQYNPIEEYLLCVTVVAPLEKRQSKNSLRIITGNAYSKSYKTCVQLRLYPTLLTPSATLDPPSLTDCNDHDNLHHDHVVVSMYDLKKSSGITTDFKQQFLQHTLHVLTDHYINFKDSYPKIYSKLEDCLQTGSATQPINFTALNENGEQVLCTIVLELPVHV
ncbi:hypothetical protein TrispH2_003078 [Trichoplax sp. H2]|nr:hypothetical protein TrispH2_003078 [Trichoplax sp. H2]|eukprot:RDD44384.1 hypothetical protein TrispH2_003078 [Trichoplax sp. H2]